MKSLKSLFYLSILFGLTGSLPAYDLRSGLLSYYPFDSSVTQDTAYTNHFTAVGTPALVPGKSGTAIKFEPAQYLRLDHDMSNVENGLPIYKAGAYSIVMWIKGPPVAARYFFTEGSTANNNALLILQTGPAAATANKFDVIIRTDGGAALVNHVVSSNVVFDDTWHHIAWVDNNGAARLYVDGNLDAANYNYTPSGTFAFNTTSIGTLLRAAVATGNIYTNGPIDEVSLWERALTQSEVQQIMTNGIATPVPALPAAIITQPSSQTKGFQENVTFSVSAAGTRPNHALSYQWFSNSVPVVDATNRTFTLLGLTTNQSGKTFSVAVSNAIGGVMSSNATLTVIPDGPVDLRNQIVSYWPLDTVTISGGFTNTIDIYSRNDLRLTNMSEANLGAGQFSNSLQFDNLANTHAIRSGGSAIFTTNASGYTVSLWVKADSSFQGDVRVFAEASTLGNNPLFTIGTAATAGTSAGARVLIRNDANATILDKTSTRPVFDDTWHHIVWVDKAGQGKLYVDGVVDETDFSYPASALTLNVTAVGSFARTTPSNIIFGNIDEVAVWNRALSYSDVQTLKTSSVPAPIAAIPPSITSQPVSVDVFTGANVTFSVGVSGTGPFNYVWSRNSTPVPGGTNGVLSLPNVQLSAAGDYAVSITGPGGSTNSATATLTVTTRPAPPTMLALDFDNRAAPAGETAAGFQSFTLDGSGAVTLQTTRLFGGVEVTVGGSNGTTADSRRRGTPVNTGTFTEENLLRDFVFSTPTTGAEGLDVTIRFLTPNQVYKGTIWSFDQANTPARVSDWFANGVLVKDDYSFDGAVLPTDNQQYQFSFDVTSDAQGTIVIQGRREVSGTGVSVFLNALRLAIPQTVVGKVELVGGNVRLTVETPDSSVAHSVVSTSDLATPFSPVSGVTTTILSPTSLQLEFAQPASGIQFYKVGRAE